MFYLFAHLTARRLIKIYIVYSTIYNFKMWFEHYKCYSLNHFLTTQNKIYKFSQNSVDFLTSLLYK